MYELMSDTEDGDRYKCKMNMSYRLVFDRDMRDLLCSFDLIFWLDVRKLQTSLIPI